MLTVCSYVLALLTRQVNANKEHAEAALREAETGMAAQQKATQELEVRGFLF
jgi:hypothetical protein